MNTYAAFSSLLENKAQAEKILHQCGVPLTDEQYVNLKNVLSENQNIGYLGLFVQLIYNGMASYEQIYVLYDRLKANRAAVKALPQDLFSYTNLRTLNRDLDLVESRLRVRQMVSKNIYDKTLRQRLLDALDTRDEVSTALQKELKAMADFAPEVQKEFFRKTNRLEDAQQFLTQLTDFNANIRTGFTYALVQEKITRVGEGLRLLVEDEARGLIVMRVMTYDASKLLGSTSWCISYSKTHWKSYVVTPGNYQYFLFNFNLPATDPLSAIGFTMDNENRFTEVQDRFDHPCRDEFFAALRKLDIKKNLFKVNEREFMEKRYAPKKVDYVTEYDYVKQQRPDNEALARIAVRELSRARFFLQYEEYFYSPKHLDLILRKLQDYKVVFRPDNWKNLLMGDDYEDDGERYDPYPEHEDDYDVTHERLLQTQLEHCKLLRKRKPESVVKMGVNVLAGFLPIQYRFAKTGKHHPHYWKNDENEHYNSLPVFVKRVKEIYTRFRGILSLKSRNALLDILRAEGGDVVKTVVDTKAKTGEDLSEYEFNNTVKSGGEVKPYIQNKINRIVKGEDVEMNDAEVRYAIEHGYQTLFRKKYAALLSQYDYRIDYEDSRIIQMLGLMPEAEAALAQRVADGDVLNSIEHSIHSTGQRRAASSPRSAT